MLAPNAAISSLPETSMAKPEISARARRSETALRRARRPRISRTSSKPTTPSSRSKPPAVPRTRLRLSRADLVCAATDCCTTVSRRWTTRSKIDELFGLRILRLVGQRLRAGANQLLLLAKLLTVFGEVIGAMSAKKNILPFLNLLFEIDLNHAGMLHLTNWRSQKGFVTHCDGLQVGS